MNIFKNKDGLKKPVKLNEEVNWKPDFIQLTTLQMLQIFFIKKLILGKDGVEEYAKIVSENIKSGKFDAHASHGKPHLEKTGHHAIPDEDVIKVYQIAVVLDNEVVEVLRAQEKLADILLSSPKFVSFSSEETDVEIGGSYVKERFYSKDGRQLTKDSSNTEAS